MTGAPKDPADAATEPPTDFMSTLPKLDGAAEARASRRIVGPYRLLRQIGHGGMGTVWLAERVDGLLKRQVALKLPHPGIATRAFHERLARERDILASLDHPNIARLHDAGIADDGQPYIALAYVQGQSLVEHCDARRLSLVERVRLFQQVLAAVQYAHAHLVIHRDIKPSNVLVDEEGRVQLLDFGIAKLLVDGQATATELTLEAGSAYTPDYASPEQVEGAPISIASDVYAAGVLLYELLVGQRPYHLPRSSRGALEEAILTREPRRASASVLPAAAAARGTTARALAGALRGDLDTILQKALRKRPEERYATIEALGQDLQRHLDGLPVLAQPDKAAYRLGKFMRRHRLPVALASAAAVALLVGAGVAAWQAHVAAQERDHALALLARNEAVTDFLGIFITEAAQASAPMTVKDLLARSELLAGTEFRHDPEHQALVLAILGMHHRTLGDGTKAEALLKRAVDAASGSRDPSFKARLACQYASAAELLGRTDEARRQLLDHARRHDVDAQTAAECYAYLSYVAQDMNDGPAAVEYARLALDKLAQAPRASPSLQASFLGNLAYGLHLSGQSEAASREYAKALARYAELGREASPNAIAIRNNWAIVSDGAGDPKSALALYEENLALIARRGVGEPPVYLLANRARALEGTGRYADAGQAYAVALAAAERSGNPVATAYCLVGLSSIAREAGDLDDADRQLRRIDALGAAARPPGGVVALAAHIQHGRIALARHQLAAARSELDAALATRRPNGATVSALTTRAEIGLGDGRLDDALQDVQQAIELAQKLQGGKPHSMRTGLALLVRGRILAQRGDAPAARDAYREAVQHLADTVDAGHPALRQARALL
jgi:serine/threonine-protein kinase